MGRLVLAGALVVSVVGIAHAAPKRKVQVETDPPGATVYLNDVDSGPVCEQTPCTIEAPIGTSTIIIRLDKYEPEIRELEVPKGKRPLQQKYKLKGAIGTIVVTSPKGAIVRIDEEDQGRAPVRIDVSSADAHHVSVVHRGKTVFDDVVEVATGDEYHVEPKLASADVPDTASSDGEAGGGGGGGGGGSASGGGEITGGADARPRGTFITAAAAFDVGFRQFSYKMPLTGNLRRETEGGQVMGGPTIELWPGRLFGVGALRGLSLFARLQFPIAGQTVTGGDVMGTVKTKWSSYEVSLRQRWTFGGFGVEVSGGFVQDGFQFVAERTDDFDKMPDSTYQSVRLGGKLAYASGSVEPYISAENRIVLSGGTVGERFADAAASGVRGSAGMALALGAITARAEGTLMRYSWRFAYDSADTSKAEGATDTIELISLVLGYSY
jgi:hypothetical protein